MVISNIPISRNITHDINNGSCFDVNFNNFVQILADAVPILSLSGKFPGLPGLYSTVPVHARQDDHQPIRHVQHQIPA